MKHALLVAALALGMTATALAARLEPTVVNLPGAPATLAYCGVNVTFPFVRVDVDFTNNQPATLRVVKMRWDFQDAFGEKVGPSSLTIRSGTYSAGARIRDTWSGGEADALMVPLGAVAKVRCSIIETLSADGTVWKAPELKPPPSPTPVLKTPPSPTPAPSGPLEATIVNLPGAPATLNYCGVFVIFPYARVDVDFTNTQPATLREVKIRWDFQDAFGAPITTFPYTYADRSGTYTQGVRIRESRLWSGSAGNIVPPMPSGLAKFRCSIIQTLSADGTVWKAPIVNPKPSP